MKVSPASRRFFSSFLFAALWVAATCLAPVAGSYSPGLSAARADEAAVESAPADAAEEAARVGKEGATIDIARIFGGESSPASVEDLRAMEQHVRDLCDRVRPCTVGLVVGQAQGSGVIISEDGYVLTAAHVIGRPGADVVFILNDGSTVRGKSLGLDTSIDAGLAKIEVADRKWDFVEMGNSAELGQGQWVLSTGHPGGFQPGRTPVVRFGRLLAKRTSVLMTDCTLVGGDSGGPLFDMEGRVIGIHSRIGGPITANMHVPVNTYRDTWDRLASGEMWGNVPRGGPWLGVVADQEANEARVQQIQPNSPAQKAGLQTGDVIVKFDGRDVKDFIGLSTLVQSKKPGDKVKIEVRRGEETLELELEMGRRE